MSDDEKQWASELSQTLKGYLQRLPKNLTIAEGVTVTMTIDTLERMCSRLQSMYSLPERIRYDDHSQEIRVFDKIFKIFVDEDTFNSQIFGAKYEDIFKSDVYQEIICPIVSSAIRRRRIAADFIDRRLCHLESYGLLRNMW